VEADSTRSHSTKEDPTATRIPGDVGHPSEKADLAFLEATRPAIATESTDL